MIFRLWPNSRDLIRIKIESNNIQATIALFKKHGINIFPQILSIIFFLMIILISNIMLTSYLEKYLVSSHLLRFLLPVLVCWDYQHIMFYNAQKKSAYAKYWAHPRKICYTSFKRFSFARIACFCNCNTRCLVGYA